MGKIVIDSLAVEASDEEMAEVVDQVSTIFRDSDGGGWMNIETEDAHKRRLGQSRVRGSSGV
jgi:hypothetical protein